MNWIHLVQDTDHWWNSCEHNKEPLGSTIGRRTLLTSQEILLHGVTQLQVTIVISSQAG
jgi:hypothetical protein